MNAIIALALSAIEDLLPLLASATSGNVQAVINFLEKIIPDVATLEPAIVTSAQNIIATLSGSGAVAADQVAALAAQSTALNAALDAQATADGLKGIPVSGS